MSRLIYIFIQSDEQENPIISICNDVRVWEDNIRLYFVTTVPWSEQSC